MIGGSMKIARTYTLMTHNPMNNPNSRSGCNELAKFAKKLTDVVTDVAKQLFPACAIIHTILSSMRFRCLLWTQKPTKTNMTSMSMTVMRNTDENEASVVRSAGQSTYATGTEPKTMQKHAKLITTLFMWIHMYSVTKRIDPIEK